MQGIPLARAFTTASLNKPRSAQSVRRAPLRIRAQDPAAPDKEEVKGEVVDCESAAYLFSVELARSHASARHRRAVRDLCSMTCMLCGLTCHYMLKLWQL